MTETFGGDTDEEEAADHYSVSAYHGSFLPGTKVADRYRIVSLVGKGGMGEVYRADDLKLGHPVALKFLTKHFSNNAERLEYFHSEVRLTRQISHPNVCRVFDIGEVDGQHFLSMEYIDWEDLQTLLRRIGRLPKTKAVEIAQHICAGLKAVHDRGVLHRDVKPANIMLDGQGQARVTDFGLARLINGGGNRVIAGTPSYMAPEQLLRGETSIQSDIYSLGLVLFELFSGVRPFESKSLDDLRRLHQEASRPRSISQLGEEVVDPDVERTILCCLEPEAKDRPKSLAELSAWLPGADPLAAAVAAGDTPSPELVAASGGDGVISARRAVSAVLILVVGLGVILGFSKYTHIAARYPVRRAPLLLADDAKRILRHFGHESSDADTAYGLMLQQNSAEDPRAGWVSRGETLCFWFRQNSGLLVPTKTRYGFDPPRVDFDSPGWAEENMGGVQLDLDGTLRWLRVIPSNEATLTATDGSSWEDWLSKELVRFNLSELKPVSVRFSSPDPADAEAAWEGSIGANKGLTYVQASQKAGRLIFFTVVQLRGDSNAQEQSRIANTWLLFGLALMLVVICGTALLVAVNLSKKRGDMRSAKRMAFVGFGVTLVAWLCGVRHVFGIEEYFFLRRALAESLFQAGVLWCVFLGIEPFARRLLPETLISMTRLLHGDVFNPRVGRDFLIGITAMVVVLAVQSIGAAAGLVRFPLEQQTNFLTNIWQAISASCGSFLFVFTMMFLFFAMIVFTRLLVRSAAIGALIVCLVFVTSLGSGLKPAEGNWFMCTAGWILIASEFAVFFCLVLRFGLLTWVSWAMVVVLFMWPISTDSSLHSFRAGLVPLVSILCIGVLSATSATGFFSTRRRS